MRSLITAVAVGTLGLLAASSPLSAQWVWLGGGATSPLSDFADYGETGFMLTGGFGHSIGESGLNVGVEGSYGQNGHKDLERDETTPTALMGRVGYDFSGQDADSSLYTFAGLGVLWHKFTTFDESTDYDLGLQAGSGVLLPAWKSPADGLKGDSSTPGSRVSTLPLLEPSQGLAFHSGDRTAGSIAALQYRHPRRSMVVQAPPVVPAIFRLRVRFPGVESRDRSAAVQPCPACTVQILCWNAPGAARESDPRVRSGIASKV